MIQKRLLMPPSFYNEWIQNGNLLSKDRENTFKIFQKQYYLLLKQILILLYKLDRFISKYHFSRRDAMYTYQNICAVLKIIWHKTDILKKIKLSIYASKYLWCMTPYLQYLPWPSLCAIDIIFCFFSSSKHHIAYKTPKSLCIIKMLMSEITA